MQSDELKNWFKHVIKINNENLTGTDETYLQTISPDFEFHANGETCNFQQWYQRYLNFKKELQSVEVEFQDVIAEGDTIAASYWVNGIKFDQSKIKIKIIGIFKVKDGKFIYCDELFWNY